MTKAAAESLPAGWMRRSSSCRGGSLVETDGAGEVRPASAVAALAGRTEGTRVRAAVGAAADGRERRLPPQAGRGPSTLGSHEHLQTRLRTPRGLTGCRGPEDREGIRLGRRPARAHRRQAEGCSRAGKRPCDPTRSLGVNPGQLPGALGKSVFILSHHHGNGRGSFCPALVPCYCVYPVYASVCLLPPSLSLDP